MLERILQDIDKNREELIDGLRQLISMGSSDGKATEAQQFVQKQLRDMGFSVECFRQDERVKDLPDYVPYDIMYDPGAYNVAGVLKGTGKADSLMLFAHIDTEAEEYFGSFDNPYESYVSNGKIYGLGASDDKGGVAMMLYAVKYVKKYLPKLPYDVTVLSIMGKHGGAFGTLSALVKGYGAKNSIYLHPAETGHGFAEIKNISLGVVDFDITVTGKQGLAHDDLSTGTNASVLAGTVVMYLEEYNQKMRKQYTFDIGSFAGQPSFILNVGSIVSEGDYGEIPQKATIRVRCRFFKPMTKESVTESMTEYLRKKCDGSMVSFDDLTIQKGNFRATPAMTDTGHPFVQLIEKNITHITGITDFIHQYHGGSDIRLPILYGDSNCVGIGPACVLPPKGSNEREWISVEDYINGVKILASVLYNYSLYAQKE